MVYTLLNSKCIDMNQCCALATALLKKGSELALLLAMVGYCKVFFNPRFIELSALCRHIEQPTEDSLSD